MKAIQADKQSVTFSHAILAQTQRLRVIAAILPGPWNPTLAAKQLASIDIYTGGRIAVNIVSGWFKREFLAINEFWLDVSVCENAGSLISVARGTIPPLVRVHPGLAFHLDADTFQLQRGLLSLQRLQPVA